MAVMMCNSSADSDGRELSQHGDISFPLAAYDDDLSVNPVTWHWHSEFEAVTVSEGYGIIRAGRKIFELSAGEGVFINSGVIHSAESCGGLFTVHALVFGADLVCGAGLSVFRERYINPLMSGPECVRLARDGEGMSAACRAWRFCEAENYGWEFGVREELSRLILVICGGLSGSHVPSPLERRRMERVKIMLSYIHGHFAENISVGDIAVSAAVSESESLRCFHAVLGTTPGKYLRDYRLMKAEELLRKDDMRIGDVAAMCGFGDVSHFTRSFRDKKGITPKEARIIPAVCKSGGVLTE